jgi:hypothetical protein
MQSVGSVRSGFSGNVQSFQSRSTSGAAQRGQLQASFYNFFAIRLKCIWTGEAMRDCACFFPVPLWHEPFASIILSTMWPNELIF